MKMKNSKRYKAHCLIILGLLIVLIIGILPVIAMDFDNIVSKPQTTFDGKQIEGNSILEKYPPIKVENIFGLGKDLAEAYLSEHTDNCGINCRSNIQIKLYEDAPLIDDIRFYTLEGDRRTLQDIRSYQFYIKTNEEEFEVNDYEWICEETGKINLNGTAEVKCENKLVGTHLEKKPLWEQYIIGDIVPAGIYEVKLEGEKKPSREVDWQIKTSGVWTTDWAVWGTASSLFEYYYNTFDDRASSTGATGAAQTFTVGTVGDNETFTITKIGLKTAKSGTPLSDYGIFIGGASSDGFNTTILYYNTTFDYNQLSNDINGGEWYNFTMTPVNESSPFVLQKGKTYSIFINSSVAEGFYIMADTGGTYAGGQVCRSSDCPSYATWDGFFEVYGGVEGSSVTLNSPVDSSSSSSNEIEFNVTTNIVGTNLVNMSLWHNGTGAFERNQTNSTISPLTNSTLFNSSFVEGTYLWNVESCDSDGDCGFAPTNKTFSIDTTTPSIIITAPTTTIDYGESGGNETINWTISDINLDSCWFEYNMTNTSVTCGDNNYSFILEDGVYYITLWANDSVGNVNSLYSSWDYKLFANSVNYSEEVVATSNENFIINLTYNSSNWISASAKLNYNGTEYSSIKTAITNNLIFNNTLIVPNPSVLTNYGFLWNISLTNVTGTYYIPTTEYFQSVNPLQEINVTYTECPSGFNASFNFTSLIEKNLTSIDFSSVAYNLQYGSSGNTSALVSSGSFSNINNFSICINSSSSYYVGYGEIQYDVNGYSARRFYIFENTRLTNTTIANNLYSLETAESTAFQITATDTTLTPYNSYYISLLRWYPDLNTYKIVDMGKTDEKGQTVINVKTNDVDYRLGLYEPDGTLVKLLEPIRMVCQTTPCVYNLIVDLEETDLTTFLNVESSLTYNPTTKVFTYIFNDPSQETTLMNLTIWQDYPDRDSIILCSTTSTDFTGVLVCDVSAYTGQLRAEVWREASPRVLIAQLLKSIRSSLIDTDSGKTMSLLIGLIMVISFALMGVVSPVLVIILGVVGLIPLIIFGVLDKATFLIIGCIAGIVLHFLRRIT